MPFKNKLYRLALRMVCNHEEAQDITQETLIRLWKRTDTLNSSSEALALGLTTCRNLSLDVIGKEGRNHEQLDNVVALQSMDSTPTPLETLTQNDSRQMLIRQINQLPEKQKTVIQLRDIEGLSYKEIAQILQITEEQVKVTLFRARQMLKAACQNKENYGL